MSDPLYLFVSRKSDLLQTEQRLHDALPLALNRKEQALTQSADRLKTAATRLLAPYEAQVSAAAGKLEALSPLKVLGRGYALATDAQGHVLKNAHDAQKGEAIRVKLAEGSLVAHIALKGAFMAEKDIKDLTFKDASVELEQIVRQLEGSDLELEESLVLYTRGVELVKDLRGRLDTAEQKVRVLLDVSEAGSAISDTTAAPSTAYVNE